MAKLLGLRGSGPAEVDDGNADLEPTLRANSDPRQDGRVAWLISEIGGWIALRQRKEDGRRDNFGRGIHGGYRTDQLDEEHAALLTVEPDDPHHDHDYREAWRGILALATSKFKAGEDVTRLLDLMAHDSEIQAEFGAGWPIASIVAALNRLYPNPPWTDDRVDNAKKRLLRWIDRIREESGFDSTDLMALFARHARGLE